MPRTVDRHFGAAGERRRRRSAGLRAEDRLFHPPPDRGRHRQVLSRPAPSRICRTAKAGRSNGSSSRPTAPPTSTRPGISPRPWIAASARSPSTRCRSNGASSRAIKLDFRHLPDGYVANAPRRRSRARAHRPHALAARDRAGEHQRRRRLWTARTMSPRAAAWAARRRFICSSAACGVTGTDGWSWDAPFVHTTEKYLASHDASLIWEGHKAGREIGYCHIEKLHNLEALPADGLHGELLPGQGARRFRRLDARGRHHRRSDTRDSVPRRKRTPAAVARDGPRYASAINDAGPEVRLFQRRTRVDRRSFVIGSAAAAAALQAILRAGRLSHARHHRDQSVSARRRCRRGRAAAARPCSSRWSSSRS